MLSVPSTLTAYQGFDALFHSTEGYMGCSASVMSGPVRPKVGRAGGPQHWPGPFGTATTRRRGQPWPWPTPWRVSSSPVSSCTSEHSLEHALSAFHHDLAHGAGLIMISEAYYTHFAELGVCDDRLVSLAKALGKADATGPMDFVAALLDLQRACGVANLKMSDYGIKREDLRVYARNAMDTMGGLFASDPAQLSEDDCVKIYEQAYR